MADVVTHVAPSHDSMPDRLLGQKIKGWFFDKMKDFTNDGSPGLFILELCPKVMRTMHAMVAKLEQAVRTGKKFSAVNPQPLKADTLETIFDEIRSDPRC